MEEDTSKMSKLFRILMKISLMPLTIDFVTKKLIFKICSRPTIFFTLYNLVVFATSLFCWSYFLGLNSFLKFWGNMWYQSNFTDFLTYFVFLSINMFSSLQYKSFDGHSKISSDLLLRKNLKWPKHGRLLLCVSVFCVVGKVMWGVFSIIARIDIGIYQILGVLVGYSIQYFWSYTIVFFVFLFFLAWLENYSQICEEYISTNLIDIPEIVWKFSNQSKMG